MATVFVELGRPITGEAARDIKRLNPSKRGITPRVNKSDTVVVCGRLTRDMVVSVLDKHGIPVLGLAVKDDTGDIKLMSAQLRRYVDRNPPSSPSLTRIVYSVDTGMDKGSIILPQPGTTQETIIDPAELQFQELLATLPETRAVPLEVGLFCICDAVNSSAPAEKKPPVQPWYLVEPADPTDPGRGISLIRLNRIAPKASDAIWKYVHTYERNDGSSNSLARLDTAEQKLLETAIQIQTNPQQLGLFWSLAMVSV